jgi:hypothetical protein
MEAGFGQDAGHAGHVGQANPASQANPANRVELRLSTPQLPGAEFCWLDRFCLAEACGLNRLCLNHVGPQGALLAHFSNRGILELIAYQRLRRPPDRNRLVGKE